MYSLAYIRNCFELRKSVMLNVIAAFFLSWAFLWNSSAENAADLHRICSSNRSVPSDSKSPHEPMLTEA